MKILNNNMILNIKLIKKIIIALFLLNYHINLKVNLKKIIFKPNNQSNSACSNNVMYPF